MAEDIRVQIGGDTRPLNRSLNQAESQVKNWGRAMERASQGMRSIGYGLMNLNPIMYAIGGAVLLIMKLRNAFTGLADDMNNIGKQAKSVNMDAESFQALAYACRHAGVSMESVINIMNRLDRAQAQVIDGNLKVAATFDKLGIDFKKFSDATPEKKLQIFIDAIAKMQKAGKNVPSDVLELVGLRNMNELNKMTQGGIPALMSIAKSNGLVINESVIKAAEALSDVNQDLTEALKAGLANLELVEKLMEWETKIKQLKQTGGLDPESGYRNIWNDVDFIMAEIDKGNEKVIKNWGHIIKQVDLEEAVQKWNFGENAVNLEAAPAERRKRMRELIGEELYKQNMSFYNPTNREDFNIYNANETARAIETHAEEARKTTFTEVAAQAFFKNEVKLAEQEFLKMGDQFLQYANNKEKAMYATWREFKAKNIDVNYEDLDYDAEPIQDPVRNYGRQIAKIRAEKLDAADALKGLDKETLSQWFSEVFTNDLTSRGGFMNAYNRGNAMARTWEVEVKEGIVGVNDQLNTIIERIPTLDGFKDAMRESMGVIR